ncbi:TRAP transporter permease [Rhizobium sp. L1K21]|uniref:TRAP transporter permease n=1 Tax=Rhizobium sp. L1K21 TaxID=2954933 RepID=UPI0020932625|nr:TRAP transporter permease [Rhizobium sp. L1K21]MCO6186264.1 TRAP transporter permease [Rhizobium sp. L1K21]
MADLEPERTLTAAELEEIERKYDPETAVRTFGPIMGFVVSAILVAMSCYHFYASGFGNVPELLHRGIHLSFVLGLTFLLFPFKRATAPGIAPSAWYRFDGVAIPDIIFSILAVAAAIYLPLLPPAVVAERVGNPSQSDILLGTALVVITLEAARRSIGPTLPIISLIFIGFAIFGPYMPGALKHGGASWLALINHLYMTNQGIYGVAIGVMAQYVFLFILFGVLATRIGLGQLFIDLAMVLAGRYSGGPAKVAIFASAFMGSISGSSIANTVTTGALTIPAMKRIGYPPHFAGAVEATSSTGGQITPPVLGAAAFIMVEYLQVPLRDILAAALIPAALHYFGIFIMVHLEAKKLGLRGLRKDEMPDIVLVLKENWLSLVPLILLVYFILAGRTPDFAAVYGIIACVVVGFLKPHNRLTLRDLWHALGDGAKNTIAVGAAAACVGIIVGIVTLTGVGFRLGYMVVQTASDVGGLFSSIWPLSYIALEQWTLFFSLVLIAFACIIMGAGIPTTATYIILVAVAGPALQQLQVQQLVAHFFVFFYGVLADITPPVALAAYAAAGIAGANPFTTGNAAFRLGIAKALVPFVFVYSPSLLLVADGFTWPSFFITLIGAASGIALIGIAFSGYLFGKISYWQRIWIGLTSFLFIAPGLETMAIGALLFAPVLVMQLRGGKTAA